MFTAPAEGWTNLKSFEALPAYNTIVPLSAIRINRWWNSDRNLWNAGILDNLLDNADQCGTENRFHYHTATALHCTDSKICDRYDHKLYDQRNVIQYNDCPKT